MDVTSLYTIIPHTDGLNMVREKLEARHTADPPVDFIILLLHFILHKNYFRFETNYYLQIMSTAMGSNVSPSYANLYICLILKKSTC
ncbi:hypothetical protein FKM82_021425 [Ascaphus truei]